MAGLLHLHNFMRWIVLLTAVLTLISSVSGIGGNKPFTKGAKRNALFFMISCDIQLLLGIILYFTKGWFTVLTSGAAMANSYNRFFSVEHMVGMLVALVMVHVAYAGAKSNADDTKKYKKVFYYTLVAIIIIIATIPWPGRPVIGRPLFPGMHV